MPILRFLFALLLAGGLVGPFFLLWELPLTNFGWIFCSLLLIYYVVLTLLLPDIVYSHRSGVMAGGFRILRMRLGLLPVQLLIGASSRLLQQGKKLPLVAVIAAYRDTRASSSEALAAHVQQSTKYQSSGSEVRRRSDRNAETHDAFSAKSLLGLLLGAIAALAVLGFFFYFTAGLQYLDIAFIQRDWQETSATLKAQTAEGSHRNSYFIYEFEYIVDGRTLSASCYGARQLETDAPLVVLYDSRAPQIAVLEHGLRVKDLPFGPVICGCISLLVLLPLPLILGHLIASIVLGPHARSKHSEDILT